MDGYFQVCPEMFDWFQVGALAGPFRDIQRVVPKTLLHCFVRVLSVTVLLDSKPSAQSDVLSTLDQVFFKDLSLLCSVQLSLNPDLSLLMIKSPRQLDAATTILHCWVVIEQVMSSAWCPQEIETKQFNLGLIKPENLVSHSYQGPSLPIAQFDCAVSSRKSPGCSKFFPLKNYEGH